MIRDYNKHKKQADLDARRQIISLLQNKLDEISEEINNQLESSSYTNKSPIAVVDYLSTIVQKHLTVPEQKAILEILTKIRNNEILRCLLNVSIYLGTIEKPEKFMIEFKKLYQPQAISSTKPIPQLPPAPSPLETPQRSKKSKGGQSVSFVFFSK